MAPRSARAGSPAVAGAGLPGGADVGAGSVPGEPGMDVQAAEIDPWMAELTGFDAPDRADGICFLFR